MKLKAVFCKAKHCISLIFIFTLILAGCSGGGTNSTGNSTASTTTTITPFKGKFTSGTVALSDANGNAVTLLNGSGSINTNGTAQVTFNSNATYPLFVSVTGTYQNEVAGGTATATITSATPLRGVIPDAQAAASGVPITAITEIAVALLKSQSPLLTGITSNSAKSAISASASAVLGQKYVQAMTPPAFDNQGHTTDPNTLQLAALAVVANSQGTGADLMTKLKSLVGQLASGSSVSSVIPATVYKNALAAVNGGNNSLLTTGASAQTIQAFTPPNNTLLSMYTATLGTINSEPDALKVAEIIPNSGIIGATIEIGGLGFDPRPENNQVVFSGFINGGNVTITTYASKATATMLSVVVPVGAITGKITVTRVGVSLSGGDTSTSAKVFTVITPTVGDGNLTVTGSDFSSLTAMTSRPNLDSTTNFLGGIGGTPGWATIDRAGTTFGRSWVGDTNSKYGQIDLFYNLSATEDFLSVTVEDPSGNTFLAGTPATTGNDHMNCHVTGTNVSPSLPDCSSWNITVDRYAGTIKFLSTPVFTSLVSSSPGKTGWMSGSFSFTPITVANGVNVLTPTITSVNPTMAPIGATVTVTGTNFNSSSSALPVVKFNGVVATIVPGSFSPTQFLVTVPYGATNGKITVVTQGGTASAFFTVGDKTTTTPTPTGTLSGSCTFPTSHFCQEYYFVGGTAGFAGCGDASSYPAGMSVISSVGSCAKSSVIGTCTTSLSGGTLKTYYYAYTGETVAHAQKSCALVNGVFN